MMSDIFIPNVNTANIITTPIQRIAAPTVPNKLTSGTAKIAPKTPPPLPCEPIAYASFTISLSSFPFVTNSFVFIWYTSINTEKLISNIAYCINFDVRYSLSAHATFIPIINVPIGKTYLIIPIIPPNISFNLIPITPDIPYIKTASKILNIINPITVKSIFDAVFFVRLAGCFLFLLLYFAIFYSFLLSQLVLL